MKKMQGSKRKRYVWLRLCVAVLGLFLFAIKGTDGTAAAVAYGQEVTDWGRVLEYEYLWGNQIAITGLKDTSLRVLEIPEEIDGYTVTKIGAYAFEDNESLLSVVLPDTVTEIGYCAFMNCQSLLNLKVPASVTYIESYAFGWSGGVDALTIDTPKGSAAERFARENGFVLRSELMEFLEADTARYGMWDLTYTEFIEIYQSIGTENDLFLKMLKEKGARHTDDTIWFDYDGMQGVEIEFEDVLTEKVYALHYAPFEYNSADLESGNWGKDCMEAYLDHGGVCSILAHIYKHFICTVLGEYDWQYRFYGNAEVNHEVLVVMTEDGRCFQADNCSIDFWWLGLEVTPDYEKIGEFGIARETEEKFSEWRENFENSESHQWHGFLCYARNENNAWVPRPVWYNYNISDWDMYMGYETPKYYICTYRGIEEVISMAGNARLEGYIDIAELGFDMSALRNSPRLVRTTIGDGQVMLTWKPVDGADKYAVSLYENGSYTMVSDTITGTEYTVTGLTNGECYIFAVQACVDGVWSERKTYRHVGGVPMAEVPAEDESFYFEQDGRGKIKITGVKDTAATELTVPSYVGGYQVTDFSAAVLYGSPALETLYVPTGISMFISNEDYSHLGQITATVVAESMELVELCRNRNISCIFCGEKPIFVVVSGEREVRASWEKLYGATGYRITVWKDGVQVAVQEYGEEDREGTVSGLAEETTYQLLVQAKINGEWSAYTDADLLTVTTYFADAGFCYEVNTDGTLTLAYPKNYYISGAVVIPEECNGRKVTKIRNSAFYQKQITSVVLPETLTELDAYAFIYCANLKEVWLSDNTTIIGYGAFMGCTSLERIYIPESVTDISWRAFPDNIVIYGHAGSAAEKRALENDLTFVEFDGRPEQVRATAGDKSVSISWNPVEFATSYIVTVEDAEGTVVKQEELTETQCVVAGLQNGKRYYVFVQSVMGTMISEVRKEDMREVCPYTLTGIQDFVTRMYQVILEREPDAGSATWINGLKDGSMTGVRVADGFVLSDEMLNKDISNEDFVKILYRAFFGREADADGLATWKNLLDAGCKKQYVFAGFANSGEFGALCAEAGIVQGRAAEYLADRQTGLSDADYKVWCFVERMYTEVLGRTADEAGVLTWVGVLKDGSYTGVKVADGFLMSEEFLAKEMTNEEYVQIMYRAFFGRDADPEGMATWTDALANGWTKQEVFAGFANSAEFGVLCEQAGIVRGTAEEQ